MTSRRHQILEDIKDTVVTVTGIVACDRWKQEGMALGVDLPRATLRWAETSERVGPAPNRRLALLTCYIDIWMQDDQGGTTTDQQLEDLAQLTEAKLMVDPQRSGLARQSEIVSIAGFPSIEGQPFAGASVEYRVQYIYLETDPTLP